VSQHRLIFPSPPPFFSIRSGPLSAPCRVVARRGRKEERLERRVRIFFSLLSFPFHLPTTGDRDRGFLRAPKNSDPELESARLPPLTFSELVAAFTPGGG